MEDKLLLQQALLIVLLVQYEYSYDHLHTQSSAPPIAIKRMSHTLTEACGMLLPVSVNMTI